MQNNIFAETDSSRFEMKDSNHSVISDGFYALTYLTIIKVVKQK